MAKGKKDGDKPETWQRSRPVYEAILEEIYLAPKKSTVPWMTRIATLLEDEFGVDAKMAAEQARAWGTEQMTARRLQYIALRFAGNILRLRAGLPVPLEMTSGQFREETTAIVVRRYPADHPDRRSQLDLMPLIGTFAGQVVPARKSYDSFRLMRQFDAAQKTLRSLDDLLGVELRAMVTLDEGKLLVESLAPPHAGERARWRWMQLYRYNRAEALRKAQRDGSTSVRRCLYGNACLSCRRGQIASETVWPCSMAVKPVSEEVQNETHG